MFPQYLHVSRLKLIAYCIWQKWGLYDRIGQMGWGIIRIGICQFKPLWALKQNLNSWWSSFWSSSKNSNKRTATLNDWACLLNNSPKVGCGTAKQQVYKSRAKRDNSDVPGFQYKDIVLFHLILKIFLWLCAEVVNTCKIHC